MHHIVKKVFGAAALTVLAVSAQAATLSVLPSVSSVAVGSTFNVTINISDLIDAGAPSLGDFDIDIHFNSALLSYSGFTWGDSIHGDQLDLAHLGSFSQADTSHANTGALNYFEVSLDDVATLNNTQAGSFGLVTLTFNALAAGSAPITLSVNALGNANGNALSAQINNGNVNVSAVPLPSALTLFTSSLFPNRAPERHVTLTSYIGGARAPHLALKGREEIVDLVLNDLRKLFGVTGAPTFEHCFVFPEAIPQYNVGYGRFKQLMSEAEAAAPGLFISGNARCGISLSDSILSAHKGAENLGNYLSRVDPHLGEQRLSHFQPA